MKNTLLAILCLTTLVSYGQKVTPDYIKKLEKIFAVRQIHYGLSFSDSIKLKHPYVTNGKSMGVLTVNNKKHPNCTLKYYVFEYTNKDSIAHDIFRFYGLREDSQFNQGPFEPIFYLDGYVFFNKGWMSDSDLINADDIVKYMSIRIADNMKMYMQYDKDRY